jgi:hypothetical protein
MRKSAPVIALVALLALGLACSTARNDQAIANDIKAKFYADAQLKTANLDVAVKDGQVTLSGEAPSDAARYQAFKLASDTQGVKSVDDRMSVKMVEAQPAPPMEEPKPAPAPKPVHRAKRLAPVEHDPIPAPAPAPAPVAAAPPPAPVAAPAEPEPPKPVKVEIPAGTDIVIRMIDGIDSEVNRTGEVFRASLDEPLMAESDVVVPRDSDVFVKLVESKSAGRIAGRSELRLELVRLQYEGKSYPLVSSTYEQVGSSRGKRTAATVGGGAAIGAIIGAIAGGGKGAAIGAAVGGAGGTAVQVLTKGQQIRVPSETRLEFRLEAPLSITYMPGENTGASRRQP